MSGVRARIERRLGGPLELHGIEVAVTKRARSSSVSSDTRAVTVANQIRTLTSARCDALADAVAVVVARLASEWPVPTRPRGPQPAAAHPGMADRTQLGRFVRGNAPLAPSLSTPMLATLPDGELSGTGNVTAGRPWGLGVHVMALSGIGTVPRVGVGGELSVFARREDYFAEIGFARWATESAYLVAGAPGRVEVGLDVLTTRRRWSPAGCHPRVAWRRIGACAGRVRPSSMRCAAARRGLAVTGGFGSAGR